MPARRPMFAVLLAVLVLVGIGSPGGAAVRAGTAGSCPSIDSGVTVLVDRGSLGGGVEVRCAPGAPGSGLDALQAAGFAYGFVPGKPGFVCTIDGAPDPCNGAPATAYWSYHHAPRGGDWTYATMGAGTRRPPVGSVEGWAFGDGDEPSAAPPAAPAVAPPPPPAPSPSPSTAPGPSPSPAPAPSPGPSPTPPPGPGAPVPPPPVGVGVPTTGSSPTTTTLADPTGAAPSTTIVASVGGSSDADGGGAGGELGTDGADGGEIAASDLSRSDGTQDDDPASVPPWLTVALLGLVVAVGAAAARRRRLGEQEPPS